LFERTKVRDTPHPRQRFLILNAPRAANTARPPGYYDLLDV